MRSAVELSAVPKRGQIDSFSRSAGCSKVILRSLILTKFLRFRRSPRGDFSNQTFSLQLSRSFFLSEPLEQKHCNQTAVC